MLSTRVGYRTIEKSRIPCTIRKNRSVPWVVAVPEEFGKHPRKQRPDCAEKQLPRQALLPKAYTGIAPTRQPGHANSRSEIRSAAGGCKRKTIPFLPILPVVRRFNWPDAKPRIGELDLERAGRGGKRLGLFQAVRKHHGGHAGAERHLAFRPSQVLRGDGLDNRVHHFQGSVVEAQRPELGCSAQV